MMGLGKCKDLDEWLMGSGQSAETADSKTQPPLFNAIGNKQAMNNPPVQPIP